MLCIITSSKRFCQKTNGINNNCSTPTKSYAYEQLVIGEYGNWTQNWIGHRYGSLNHFN